MRRKKDVKKPLLLFLLLLVPILYLRFSETYRYRSDNITCKILYSNGTCVGGKLVIWFSNPNREALKGIKIIVPTERGEDIYNVKEPLLPFEIKSLKLNSCYNFPRDFSTYTLLWCCKSGCFRTYMENPTEINVSEVYEEPRSLDVCRLIRDEIRMLFCYADVAEITNNVTICYFIKNPDIYYHCMARVTMNENLCDNIVDVELKEACHESINLKKIWSESI